MNFEVGQPVIMTENRSRQIREIPGKVVKIGRVWIDIEPDSGGLALRYRKDTQKDGSGIGAGSYFFTLEQWERRSREMAAEEFLRGQGISLGYGSPWRGREIELANLIRAAEEKQEVVSVAVPQLNNGTQTLVVFAVPFAETFRHAEENDHRAMTFDEASNVALGPPTVLTKFDFDA